VTSEGCDCGRSMSCPASVRGRSAFWGRLRARAEANRHFGGALSVAFTASELDPAVSSAFRGRSPRGLPQSLVEDSLFLGKLGAQNALFLGVLGAVLAPE